MFNKETEYAIRSLVYIRLQNMNGRRPGTAEISKETGSPQFFTAKILQRLVRSGYLYSLKGKGGGFFLDKEKELSLIDLITAIEGSSSVHACVFGLKNCSEESPCPLHERYSPVREALKKIVSEETITSLAEKMRKKESSGIKVV